MESTNQQKITPPEYARRLGVDPMKVIRWIRSGELRAINVATKANGRPRYVIDERDIEAFELRRSFVTPKKITRRRQQLPKDFIRYFS
jgi:predicted site-specific integrase-resolvase